MVQDQVTLVEMEDKLRADRAGAYRDEVIATFRTQLAALDKQLAGGLTPEEFGPAQQIKVALEQAVHVVGTAWKLYHGDGGAAKAAAPAGN